MNIGDYKQKFRESFGGLILVIVLFSSCEKFENTYIAVSSKEQKLMNGNWVLQNATKDGLAISLPLCAASFPSGGYDVSFRTPGEVDINCPLLLEKSGANLGTWELKDKKNIEIILTDSTYYDYVNYQHIYVPVTPVSIKWEIKKVTGKMLHVKEIRTNSIWEFIFNNPN